MISHTPVHARDGGAAIEYRFPSGIGVGTRGGVLRDEVGHSAGGFTSGVEEGRTYTNTYVNPLSTKPNSFRAEVTVDYTLQIGGWARLRVYDLAGRMLAELVNGDHTSGLHERSWDGRDASGRALPSGLYMLILESNGGTRITRAALVH